MTRAELLQLKQELEATANNTAINTLTQAEQDLINRFKNATSLQTGELKRFIKEYKQLTRNNSVFSAQNSPFNDLTASVTKLSDGLTTASKAAGDFNSSMESFGRSMSSFEKLGGIDKQLTSIADGVISIATSINELDPSSASSIIDSFDGVSDLVSQIASTNKDDIITRHSLMMQFNKSRQDAIDMLNSDLTLSQEQRDTLIEQLQATENIANEAYLWAEQSERVKNSYNEARQTIDDLKEGFSDAFKSPLSALSVAVAGLGGLGEKLLEVYESTGEISLSATIMSTVFEDAVGTFTKMTDLAGSIADATLLSQTRVNLMAEGMGIAGEEAANLVNMFGALAGQTESIGMDTVESISAFARANDLLASEVMTDISSHGEMFAKYSKEGSDNMARAAVFAKKLGASLDEFESIADSMLDFESLITNQAELSAMMNGKRIDFSVAAQYAYTGDTEKMTREVINQIGTLEEFNRLDVFQRKKIAETLGVSLSSLQQMLANYKENNGELEESNGQIDSMSESLRGIGKILLDKSGWLFTLVGQLLQAKIAAASISASLGSGSFLRNLFSFSSATAPTIAAGAAGAVSTTPVNTTTFTSGSPQNLSPINQTTTNPTITQQATPQPTTQRTAQPSSQSPANNRSMLDKFGSAKQILSIAVALIALAAAMWIMSIAYQNFASVTENAGSAFAMMIGTMGAMVLALYGLSIALAGFSAASITMWPAIGILVAFGASILAVGFGMSLIVKSLDGFSNGFKNLASLSLSVLYIAGAITMLSIAMAALGVATSTALPALAAFLIVGGAITALASLFGMSTSKNETSSIDGKSKSKTLDDVVSSIEKLRTDLSSGKVAVYLDSYKVSKQLNSKLNERSLSTGRGGTE